MCFLLITIFGCSTQKDLHFIDSKTFIDEQENFKSIDERDFLYLDTTLYNLLPSIRDTLDSINLSMYLIHPNDTFVLVLDRDYRSVEEFLKNPPITFYGFFQKTFGFEQKSLTILPNILIHNQKAYLEVNNQGSYVGLVLELMENRRIYLGIIYVETP